MNLFKFDIHSLEFEPIFEELNPHLELGITAIYTDRQDNLWIGTQEGLLLKKKNNRGKTHRLLNGIFISKIIQDHEGNYWFSTQKDGIFFLPSMDIQSFKNPNIINHISAVNTNSKDEIFIGFDNGYINILDQNFKLLENWKVPPKNNEIYDIFLDTLDNLYLFNSKNMVYMTPDYEVLNIKKGSFKTGFATAPGVSWYGTGVSYGHHNFEKDSTVNIIKERTYALLNINEDEKWIGTVKGLYHHKNGTVKKIPHPLLLNQDIRDIKITADSMLWLATQANGLILYKQDSIYHHFTVDNGLASNNCNRLVVDNNYVWLATNKGINKVSIHDLTLTSINIDNGLPSNEVNDLHKFKNKMLAATNAGLAVFQDTIRIQSNPPLLEIKSVSIKGVTRELRSFYELNYKENNIQIDFGGIAFRQANDLAYQYVMDGLFDDPISTTVTEAQFPALAPGNYTFSIKAKTKNSEWSEIKQLSFYIKKPFWQEWWFLIMVFLTIGTLVYSLFNFLLKDIQKRNETQEKLKASQLTALRAQMNPHFLFNSLNSIQEFIINQDKRSANRYLSRFSRLMRNILNMSALDQIYLQKEIESLELYLSLEALRFEENFDYSIDIDPAVDTENIMLPPMLVQPYVENAVKHGLLHKSGKKVLTIRFNLDRNFLVCEVEDNGIGRKRSMEIQQKDSRLYSSKAMSLTQERLDLLNSAYKNQLNVEIIDLEDLMRIPNGTKVILRISIK